MHTERALFLGNADSAIYTVEYIPREDPSGLFLLLPPLDNEAAYSTNLYVRIARRLAQSGAAAMRFHYRGTGNSTGEFGDVTMASLYDDIEIVRRHARERFGDGLVSLVGGRFGASLAVQFASQGDAAHSLILMDPILRPDREFRKNFVNKTLLNNKLMGGSLLSTRALDDAAAAQGCVELNGALFSVAFYREMWEWTLDLSAIERAPAVRVFLTCCVSGPESTVLQQIENLAAGVETFSRAGSRNTWAAEQFSCTEEARFLGDGVLAFAPLAFAQICQAN